MRKHWFVNFYAIMCSILVVSIPSAISGSGVNDLQSSVSEVVKSLMQDQGLPGMAVGVTADGKRSLYYFGLADKEKGLEVTEKTLFEIGSISKVYTATLGGVARATGKLSLSDPAANYLPDLKDTAYTRISLLQLGTYTGGGLPLQFPDSVSSDSEMLRYLKTWKPAYAPGTHRVYSNPSIGLFGYLVAESMQAPFDALMEKHVFRQLQLNNTYLKVPNDRVADYAFGYSKEQKPVRVNPGVFDSQAYGVKTTAGDLLQFLEAHMGLMPLNDEMQMAVAATQTGYYKVGKMTQGLGWEMYPYPMELSDLLEGNSSKMVYEANPVKVIDPPMKPGPHTLLNKTGSTGGFGAYALFVPDLKIGIVLLANKNYPVPERIKAAHAILKAVIAK